MDINTFLRMPLRVQVPENAVENACKHEDSIVVDSRHREDGIRRRRECVSCKHRWTTIEVPLKKESKKVSEVKKPVKKLTKKEIKEMINQFGFAIL